MRLTTPFTILNKNFPEMNFIREAMTSRKLAYERLHEDCRKIYKNHKFAY